MKSNTCPKCGDNLLATTRNGVRQIVCGNERCDFRTTVDDRTLRLELQLVDADDAFVAMATMVIDDETVADILTDID